MHSYLFSLAVLLALLFSTVSVTVQAEVKPETCVVSGHYAEAVNENAATLLKMLGMVNSPTSPLDDAGTAGVYYAMLLSTRQYHERNHSDLPDCAQKLNLALIKTISATEDVLFMKVAQLANPEHRRYEDRLEQTVEHLNQTWQTFAAVFQSTLLTPDIG
jgi:hypothetical protein